MNLEQYIEKHLEEYENPFGNSPRPYELKYFKKAANAAKTMPFPEGTPGALKKTLEKKGISSLYSHQFEALEHYKNRKDFIITTPTASGKTLSYLLPILNDKLKNPHGRHLFLFPTKALAQDQLALFREFKSEIGQDWSISTFDGDTPVPERRNVKLSGEFVLSNPDMLHAGILPNHTSWKKFFNSLRTIVVDEMHIYLGIFGSHVGNVFRRLNRLLAHYGSKPIYIFTSATIANPRELALLLCERECELIDTSGAPSGNKHFMILNPPIVDATGNRQSPYRLAARLGADLVANQIAGIYFARSRNRVEILYELLRSRLAAHLKNKVRPYRGGYLPLERRKIEQKMREGKLLGIISTNALELGIDIGSLQVAVSIGYPGRMSSLLQQFGRSGRSGDDAAAIMIASASALDQYIFRNPEFIKKGQSDVAVIHPNNLLIFLDHIKCAAYELPFKEDDFFGGQNINEYLNYLVENSVLHKNGDTYFWVEETYPASNISLRSAAQENFVVVDSTQKGQEEVIGRVDLFSAPTLIHTGAIYMHAGSHFYVDELDWEKRRANVHKVHSDYYTDAQQKSRLSVLSREENQKTNDIEMVYGEVSITTKALLYKKIKISTSENLGWGKIYTPELEMHTQAAWFQIPGNCFQDIPDQHKDILLSKMALLFLQMAPVIALCDRSDLNIEGFYNDPQFSEHAIVFFDRFPGGVGLSFRLMQNLESLLVLANSTLAECACKSGCPSCIGPSDLEDEINFKSHVLFLLETLKNNF